MADYYAYITPGHDKIGVLTYGAATNTTDNWSKYAGDVKLIYRKYDAALSADTSSPSFNSRFHMALVYGALWLMGFGQYESLFNNYMRTARDTKSGRKHFQIKQFDY